MTTKVKRKVTVENNKDNDEHPRRPSVFERLGPNAVNIAPQPADRHNRTEQNEKCRNWLRTGSCVYGSTCRYQHDPFPSSSRRTAKSEKEVDEKDLRHKVRTKQRDEPKESRPCSVSPKRKGNKRSNSRSRKGEHESKIKSTVVVTRPRSPSGTNVEASEPKKKADGTWEEDSDDWPMDAAQLDYKEELTLERKRQQLQRELELEIQKERLLNESVTITKTVSFSESSSSSSSSDSGSITSSSGSSSSGSDDDSDDSTSSSTSSSSSSGSRAPAKRRSKKISKSTVSEKCGKAKDDYDKIKSSRVAKAQKVRTPSPVDVRSGKKGREKQNASSLSPKRRIPESRSTTGGRANLNVRLRGPRTPSPVSASRKQRQWEQSSSTDSRSADLQHNRGKRHKKKKDLPKGDKYKSERGPTPPPLSSPNRTALIPSLQSSKKSKQKEDSGGVKSRYHMREPSPLLMSRNVAPGAQPLKLIGTSRYPSDEKIGEKHRSNDRSKFYSRKDVEDLVPLHKRTDSRDRSGKRPRVSPRKDNRRGSISPHKDRYDSDFLSSVNRKLYPSSIAHDKEDKNDRRRASASPGRNERRKITNESEKKRDIREISPRGHDRGSNQYRNNDMHSYDKRAVEPKMKRLASPDPKKGREDRNREHGQKEKNADYEPSSWSGDHRKSNASSTGHRTPESRSRQEIRSQSSLSRNDRSRERDQERKKRKERDLPGRPVDDTERPRLSPSRRSQSPAHNHHGVREIESLTGNRGRMYESDVPSAEREYAYGYDPLHDPYINDRLLPSDYEPDVMRGHPIYPADVYPEPRYRRDVKESSGMIDRYGPRDVMSPRDMLPHRDIINLTGRNEDYLPDMPIDERGYEERWPRGRGRNDWDPYPAIPPVPLPPHVAAGLDEDRYGMPRRRRASPEWQRGRIDDREPPMGALGHRQMGRGQLPLRDGRSRSPPKGPGTNRGGWNGRGGRHDSRNIELKHEESQKNMDDRKGRIIRRDRGKRKDDSVNDGKSVAATKDKIVGKRLRSPSPLAKEIKRRKEDVQTPESAASEKGSVFYKKNKEEGKSDSKSTLGGHSQKMIKDKSDVASPKSDTADNSLLSQEREPQIKVINEAKFKEREERKLRRNEDGVHGDDFSDWSDGDDDLLNRDDFVELEGNIENAKVRHKVEEKKNDDGMFGSLKRKEKFVKEYTQDSKKVKECISRTSSKDRSTDEPMVHSKDNKPVLDGKDADVQETFSVKDDTATDVEEYITAESVDYDPISDDELDALIEEPDESLMKPINENEKSKIVDSLDVDWSTLMSETKTEFKPGFARRRFKAAHVLSRIGFSQVFAGPQLSEKIISICQKQLKEESEQNEGENVQQQYAKEEKKFMVEHQVAAFHVAISQSKRERVNIFNQVGPYRRALCARRDLQIRKLLCRPINKFTTLSVASYSPQYSVVDKDLYKQSLELLKLKRNPEIKPQTVDVC